ncbi:hypothetical protein [Aestuariivirga sp.]|uniref:hypothetical protein n=1 Tax=Aestuariivirga sp. TaxID=2650926 RepID=UPI00391A04CD
MTARSTLTFLALSAALWAPAGAEASQRLAQGATPLEIPAAPGAASPTPQATPPAPTPFATPAAPAGEDGEMQEEPGDVPPDEELSLGEIPAIETIELTPDLAKRALDSYIAAKDKYANSDLDQYENLQDFVDQTEDGKAFEADVRAAGFANVSDWNLAVTTLGLTYGSIIDDQTADLQQQIKEVEEDTELAQDIKDRMVKALKALIPSENNKAVIEGLMADPVYGEKLKQLDIEEE